MEYKLTERCCLGKFFGEDCDKTIAEILAG